MIFPHCGAGMKHLRKIELQYWQKQIINPTELVKGLMFSDGCFYYDKFNKKYFYNFSNCSPDIIDILTQSLINIGVHYNFNKKHKLNKNSTIKGREVCARVLANHVNICSIASVKKLHDLIGDKNNPIVTHGLKEIAEKVKEYDYETVIELELNLREKKHKSDEEIKILETCDCGSHKNRYAVKCIKCSNIENNKKHRKFEISKEELESLIREKPMTAIGKIYGVSDNAVKKRCMVLGIELKPMRGYWAKQKALDKTE